MPETPENRISENQYREGPGDVDGEILSPADLDAAISFHDSLGDAIQQLDKVAPLVQAELLAALRKVLHSLARFVISLSKDSYPTTKRLVAETFQTCGLDGELYSLRISLAALEGINVGGPSTNREILRALLETLSTAKEFRSLLQKDFHNDRSLWPSTTAKIGNDFGTHLGAAQIMLDLVQSRSQVEDVLASAREAAGEVGSISLGIHFQSYANRERRSANVLRGGALTVTLALIALTAFLILTVPTDVNATSPADLLRLSLALPVAALAGYLGREASRHRRVANWAQQREVQLMTVEAYVAPMSEKDKQKVRLDLGRKVFGSDLPDRAAAEDSPSAVGGLRRTTRTPP